MKVSCPTREAKARLNRLNGRFWDFLVGRLASEQPHRSLLQTLPAAVLPEAALSAAASAALSSSSHCFNLSAQIAASALSAAAIIYPQQPCLLRLPSTTFVGSSTFVGNVTPTDYIRRWAYPGQNGIMVITRDCQHMSRINNPNHLEHMMSLDTNCTGARTLERTTNIQPVAGHIELRTVVPSEMLPHPPATPLYRSPS